MPPFSEYNIMRGITHLKTFLCNNTLRFILLKAFLSGRIPSELHCLFCRSAYICHTSQAALKILPNHQVRLFVTSEAERLYVQIYKGIYYAFW